MGNWFSKEETTLQKLERAEAEADDHARLVAREEALAAKGEIGPGRTLTRDILVGGFAELGIAASVWLGLESTIIAAGSLTFYQVSRTLSWLVLWLPQVLLLFWRL